MDTEKIVTLEEVQGEIKSLDKRHKDGKESDPVYNLKKKALETAEAIVKKGSNGWHEKLQKD